MDKFILLAIFACHVISNNNIWGVSGEARSRSLVSFNEFVKREFSSLVENDKVLKEKCFNKTQSNDAYEIIMKAKEEYKVCVKSIVDGMQSEFDKEIARNKSKSSFEIAKNEYCKKLPNLNDCDLNCMSTVDVCLDEGERDSLIIIHNVTKDWSSFTCSQDSVATLFVAVNGQYCYLLKNNAIQYCENTTIDKYIPRGDQSVSSLVSFKFGEDQCKSMSELQVCVIAELKKCENQSAANYFKSWFNLLFRLTCSKFQTTQTRHQTAGNELLHGNISIPAIVLKLKKT